MSIYAINHWGKKHLICIYSHNISKLSTPVKYAPYEGYLSLRSGLFLWADASLKNTNVTYFYFTNFSLVKNTSDLEIKCIAFLV